MFASPQYSENKDKKLENWPIGASCDANLSEELPILNPTHRLHSPGN